MADIQSTKVKIEKFRSKYAFKKRLLFFEKSKSAFAGLTLQAIDQFKGNKIIHKLESYYDQGFTHVIIYLTEDV